jgi:PIN domain nuclease of toxin-antitoxin system
MLLDTHTFLWYVDSDAQLSAHARSVIQDPGNEVLVSVASLWEIAVKASLGKLSLAAPYEVLMPYVLTITGFKLLDISLRHLVMLGDLPMHHRDPFDRLLIAQAASDYLPTLTRDPQFALYPVTIIW